LFHYCNLVTFQHLSTEWKTSLLQSISYCASCMS
jgi:hypothetical protein